MSHFIANTEVHLVVPPYAPLAMASLGTSLLKAGLTKAGISSSVRYLNLAHADLIGIAKYEFLGVHSGPSLLGEWTFAEAAFPDDDRDDSAYFAFVENYHSKLLGAKAAKAMMRLHLEDPDSLASLLNIRRSAGKLIKQTALEIVCLAPRIVGCSSTFQQHCASLALLREIRKLDPSIVTVLGGGNCDGVMGQATHMAFPWLDYVVSGEADVVFPALCRRILGHDAPLPRGHLPDGVYARHEMPPLNWSPRAQVENMDETPMPDMAEYFQQLEATSINRYIYPVLPIETSRGCWWGERSHCTFCGLNGTSMAYRSKSADRVVNEFATLSKLHNSTRFAAVDNILDMHYFNTVLPRLAAAKPDYEIFYETKANLDKTRVKQLAEAGISGIQPGIESLHDVPLKEMAKGTTAITNIKLLKYARECGIYVTWSVLTGLPGEKDRHYGEMADLIQLLTHLAPPMGVNIIEWHRFSPYFDQASAFGLKLQPLGSYRHIYPISSEHIANLAYVFEEVTPPNAQRLRPGWQRLCTSIRSWLAAWDQPVQPQLIKIRQGDLLLIIDTRAGFDSKETLLTDVAAAIIEASDHGCTRKKLDKTMATLLGHTIITSEIDVQLNLLIEAGFVIDIGGKILSLPTLKPDIDCRNTLGYGLTDIHTYLSDQVEKRSQLLANDPRNIPLKNLFPY